MLTNVNDTIIYNDSLVCRQAGYYREAQEQLMPALDKIEKEKRISFGLYPNPGKDKLTLSFDGNELNGEVIFYNALGTLVRTYYIAKESKLKEIDIASLADGYYIICYTTGNYFSNKSFIKIK